MIFCTFEFRDWKCVISIGELCKFRCQRYTISIWKRNDIFKESLINELTSYNTEFSICAMFILRWANTVRALTWNLTIRSIQLNSWTKASHFRIRKHKTGRVSPRRRDRDPESSVFLLFPSAPLNFDILNDTARMLAGERVQLRDLMTITDRGNCDIEFIGLRKHLACLRDGVGPICAHINSQFA